MTEPLNDDDRLRALFALDAPPPRDPWFEIEAMRRIGQRRFWFGLAASVPWLVAATAILWALGPILVQVGDAFTRGVASLAPLGQGLAVLAPLAGVATGLVLLAAPFGRRF
jgi:hypothetical protein